MGGGDVPAAADEAPADEPAPAAPAAPPAAPGARVVGPQNPAADPPPGPAGDSAEAAARPPAPEPAPARPRPTEDVLDLGEASREAVMKRVAPAAAGIVLFLLLLWRRRR
jgi:hypothetical protein